MKNDIHKEFYKQLSANGNSNPNNIKNEKNSCIKVYDNARYSLIVGLTKMEWIVKVNNQIFLLQEILSYFKIIILLEESYEDILKNVQNNLKSLDFKGDLRSLFPFVEIVECALKNEQEYWIDCALEWIPKFSEEQQKYLLKYLKEIISNKKYSQGLRHKALKLTQKI